MEEKEEEEILFSFSSYILTMDELEGGNIRLLLPADTVGVAGVHA